MMQYKNEWFIELLTEKLPKVCQVDQKQNVLDKLKNISCIDVEDIYVQCTPNRFVLLLTFKKKEQMIKGPRVGVDNHILQKFSNKYDVQVDDLINIDQVWHCKHEVSDAELNAQLLNIILNLDWPEYMIWGQKQLWPRPIRHICMMLNWQHNPIYVDALGLHTSNQSRVSIYNSTECFQVQNFTQYIANLKQEGVIVDIQERIQGIRDQLSKNDHCIAEADIQKFAKFSEAPVLCICDYTNVNMPNAFINLSIVQDYIATCINQSSICNKFVTCLDGGLADIYNDTVHHGLSRAVSSRIKEMQRLWNYDILLPIEFYIDSLSKKEIFGNKLGSYAQRGMRIQKVCAFFKIHIEKLYTIEVGKAMTILNEFDNIDLLCSGLYFDSSLEMSQIALHIYDLNQHDGNVYEYISQKLKTVSDDALYKKSLLICMIMNIDMLIGLFGAGVTFKGSQDPFAMRKLGTIVTCINHVLKIKFSDIYIPLLQQYAEQNIGLIDHNHIIDMFHAFMSKRIDWFLSSYNDIYYTFVSKNMLMKCYGIDIIDDIRNHIDLFNKIPSLYKRINGICKLHDVSSAKFDPNIKIDTPEYNEILSKIDMIDIDIMHNISSNIYNLLYSANALLDKIIINDLTGQVKVNIIMILQKSLDITQSIYHLS